jgi:hypothetical protein
MIWHRQFHALIPKNPITTRELTHQQRTFSSRAKLADTVGIVAVAFIWATLLVLTALFDLNHRFRPQIRYVEISQVLAWLFHLIVILRLLIAGGEVVLRDSFLIQSTELLLTPVSRWRLLLGKWWAVLHQMRGWMLALGILHLGLIFSAAVNDMTIFDYTKQCLNPCVYTIGRTDASNWVTRGRSFILATAVIIITLLETLCCTALGMVATLFTHNRIAIIGAILLRFAPIIIFSIFPDYASGFPGIMRRYFQYTWFSFADGGTGALIQLAHYEFQRGLRGIYVLTGMYIIYLIFTAVVAQMLLWRSRE